MVIVFALLLMTYLFDWLFKNYRPKKEEVKSNSGHQINLDGEDIPGDDGIEFDDKEGGEDQQGYDHLAD